MTIGVRNAIDEWNSPNSTMPRLMATNGWSARPIVAAAAGL